jgi:hypothetical protein
LTWLNLEPLGLRDLGLRSLSLLGSWDCRCMVLCPAITISSCSWVRMLILWVTLYTVLVVSHLNACTARHGGACL